ncbi:MAG: hypothetical protein ACRDHP_13870 [Ktedonobacterales bacterium]
MLSLDTLKAIVIEAETRVRAHAGLGQYEAAEATYDTLLHLLHTLLASDTSARAGWRRVALLITDQRLRLALDALADSRFSQLAIRAGALTSLPDLPIIRDPRDIAATLAAAIQAGAPRYNTGNIRDCATIYWTTLQTLVFTPLMDGVTGHERALARLLALASAEPPLAALDATGVDRFAWELRHCFDGALDALDLTDSNPMRILPGGSGFPAISIAPPNAATLPDPDPDPSLPNPNSILGRKVRQRLAH